MNPNPTLLNRLPWVQKRAWVGAAVALALALILALFNAHQFLESWLFATIFWLGLSLGCLSILMLAHLVRGDWAWACRRPMEAGALTLPYTSLFLIPILVGVKAIYPWTHESDEVIASKAAYLNIPFFILRSILYVACWNFILLTLLRRSRAQEENPSFENAYRLQVVSARGMVGWFLTMTFAAVDWGMSLDPHWYSIIYGVLYIVGQGLSALAVLLLVFSLFYKYEPFSTTLTPKHFSDVGNLVLAMVVFWAYVNFAQLLVIWSGNIQEEVTWYKRRMTPGWNFVSFALVFFHFVFPFLFLLFRAVKRTPRALVVIAIWILFFRAINVFWMIAPEFHPDRLHVHIQDFLIFIGLGGIWIGFFALKLRSRSWFAPVDLEFTGQTQHAPTASQKTTPP